MRLFPFTFLQNLGNLPCLLATAVWCVLGGSIDILWWKRLAIWESCDSDVSTSIVLLVSRWYYGAPAVAISDDMVRSSLFPATGFSNITI